MRQFRINRDNWWVLRDILAAHENFTISTGNMWGEATKYVTTSHGRLPEPWLADLKAANGKLEYVVYSYATPIAWCSNGVWTVPDVSYSKTTTKQQGKVKVAIAEMTVAA